MYCRLGFTENSCSRNKIQTEINGFLKSKTGIELAEEMADKIRDCHDWEDLYDGLQCNGTIAIHTKKKIMEEIKWNKT